MNIYFRLFFQNDDYNSNSGNDSISQNRVARSSLLGAQYKEAIAVEDYTTAENIMDSLKKLG